MPKSTKPEHCIGIFTQPEFGQIAEQMGEYAADPDAILRVFKHGDSITMLIVGGPDDDGDEDTQPDGDDDDNGINNSHPCPGSPGCP